MLYGSNDVSCATAQGLANVRRLHERPMRGLANGSTFAGCFTLLFTPEISRQAVILAAAWNNPSDGA